MVLKSTMKLWNYDSSLVSTTFVLKYSWNAGEILATSATLTLWWLKPSSRIQIIFPSRSISNLFDFSKYLSIAFILTRFSFGPNNLFKSLTFGYPPVFFMVSRKKSKSSSVISFAALCFFFVNFLFLIRITISVIILKPLSCQSQRS